MIIIICLFVFRLLVIILYMNSKMPVASAQFVTCLLHMYYVGITSALHKRNLHVTIVLHFKNVG